MRLTIRRTGTSACRLLMTLLLLAAMNEVMRAQSSSAVKPNWSFTSSSLEVTVGQLNVDKPTLAVTDPNTGKPIRGRFVERWGIIDANGKEVTESEKVDHRVKFTDPTTGSTVNQLYGLDAIGKKTGSFKVFDELIPQERYKDKYQSVTATYTVKVKSPTVTVEYYNGSTLLNSATILQLYSFKDQSGNDKYTSLPVPAAKLYYTLDNTTYDVTSDYDYSYSVTNGFSVEKNSITTSLKDGGTGTLTITATPKNDYKDMLGSDAIVRTISLQTTYRSKKIKTYITFASNEEDVLRYRNMPGNFLEHNSYSPDLIVKDEFGNDITSLITGSTSNTIGFFSASFKALNAFNQFSTDPNDAVKNGQEHYALKDEHTNGMNTPQVRIVDGKMKVFIDYHEHPDDYLMTVTFTPQDYTEWDQVFGKNGIYEYPTAKTDKITVEGQFYNQNSANQYTVESNQFILRVHKRAPQIVLTPDPKTVNFAQGYTMTQFNRFDVSCVFHDPYEPNDPDEVRHALDDSGGFQYWFFVPDEYKYDESLTEEANKAKAKELGHALIRIKTEAMKNPKEMIQTDREEWVPVYNTDGTPKTDENGKQEQTLMKGTYYKSMIGYGNETFTVAFFGDGLYAPLIYKNVPWNFDAQNVRSTNTYFVKITDREPTHFVIDPEKQVTGVDGTLSSPSITIQDQFGADVTSYFTVTRKKADENGAYTLGKDGSVTSSNEGTYSVTVSGALTDNTSTTSLGRYFDNPADGSYTDVFKQPTSQDGIGAYEIIYDENEFSTDATKQAGSKMGKLHFIKKGDFYPGTISYGEVPGINITFGSATDAQNVWNIKTTSEGSLIDNNNDKDAEGKIAKEFIMGDVVTVDDNTSLPKAGCFPNIDAITNGWLTIDSKFLGHYDDPNLGREHYILVDAATKEMQRKSCKEDSIGEYTYPKPLLAGHTYYLYTDDGHMILHGLSYNPGFIDPVTDDEPWTSPGAVDLKAVTRSSAFMNGYTGTLPTLTMNRQNEKVSWYVKDVASGSTSTSVGDIKDLTNDDAKHVYVGNKDGRIYAERLTTEKPLTDDTRKNTDAYGRVRVFANVLGKKLSDTHQVMKQPGYWLFVGDIPTYIVKDGESHDQDDRVSTQNIPSRIWMTFGGWHWSQNKDYPYYNSNDQTKDWVEDGWQTSQMDPSGNNDHTIDGFQYVTWGEQNPTDEFVRSWDHGTHSTFNLPVRGSYLKFEPEESGTLMVYLVQNGMTDNDANDNAAELAKNGPWLRRRAVYIVDETGHPVRIDALSGWESTAMDWNKYVNAGTTNADRYTGYHNWSLNYFCDGETRCAWEYDKTGAQAKTLQISTADPATATGDEKKYSWFDAYDRDNDGKLTDTEKANMEADKTKIESWWTSPNYSFSKTVNGKTLTSSLNHAKLGGPLELIQLSDSSFVLPTKGYVRYVFPVQAGKVYYVFATGTKLGFSGFAFLPTGFRTYPERWINAGQNNSYGEYAESVYKQLPQPDDEVYTTGGVGNNRLMGGSVTLDASKKAGDAVSNEVYSYGKFREGGFVIASDNANTLSKTTKRDFIDVTLKRTFRNQRWQGLCLPFTVSESQMKRLFGDDMQLITIDSVMASKGHERTLHFTQHVNQLCEAGRPYFIRPNVSGKAAGESLGESLTFKGVSFENVDTMQVVMYNETVRAYNKTHTDKPIDIFTYQVTGTYNKCIIPWQSYYMKNAEKEEENKLYRIVPKGTTTAKGAFLPGCNVYLFPYSYDPAGEVLVKTGTDKAKLASFWITGAEVSGGTTTDIDKLVNDLNEQDTALYRGVYDVQGRLVRSENSLKGLTPGIYLMGGKKYVVK